jgi:hypothetical protein
MTLAKKAVVGVVKTKKTSTSLMSLMRTLSLNERGFGQHNTLFWACYEVVSDGVSTEVYTPHQEVNP